MHNVHLTYSGKGGVGKSLIAALLTQWLQARGTQFAAFDTDPLTPSFKAFKALPVERVNLIHPQDKSIDPRAFETMYARIIEGETEHVVDIGASNFHELDRHIQQQEVFPLLYSVERRPVLHAPLAAGGNLDMSFQSLVHVLETAADLPAGVRPRIVVWLNEHEGKIERRVGGGEVPFEEDPIYRAHKANIHGLVTIKKLDEKLDGEALTRVLKDKLTFEEVAQSTDFNLFDKMRMNRFRDEMFAQLDNVIGAAG